MENFYSLITIKFRSSGKQRVSGGVRKGRNTKIAYLCYMILNKLMVNIRNERKSAHIAFFPYRSLRMEVEDSSCRIPPRQVECIRVENYINMNINGMILEYNKIYCSLPASFFLARMESLSYTIRIPSRGGCYPAIASRHCHMQIINIGETPFQRIHINFVGIRYRC